MASPETSSQGCDFNPKKAAPDSSEGEVRQSGAEKLQSG
jgi:hypothetical protein